MTKNLTIWKPMINQTTVETEMNFSFEQIGTCIGMFVDADILHVNNEDDLIQNFFPRMTDGINNTVFANVNSRPITEEEIALRKEPREAHGKTADDDFIFNLLIEGKYNLAKMSIGTFAGCMINII
ncbi:MAG: hypothetical protein PHN47_05385 [Clostridia bacterium]|jgi:hypothetical protein|nr:hypothetical protein [Clostridia bacterium]